MHSRLCELLFMYLEYGIKSQGWNGTTRYGHSMRPARHIHVTSANSLLPSCRRIIQRANSLQGQSPRAIRGRAKQVGKRMDGQNSGCGGWGLPIFTVLAAAVSSKPCGSSGWGSDGGQAHPIFIPAVTKWPRHHCHYWMTRSGGGVCENGLPASTNSPPPTPATTTAEWSKTQ